MSDEIEPTKPEATQDDVIRDDEQLVQIYATADATDGMMAKGRLEAEGIPVFIKGSATDQAYPVTGTFLFVGQDDAGRAKEILGDAEDGDFELADGEDPEAAG